MKKLICNIISKLTNNTICFNWCDLNNNNCGKKKKAK